MAMEVTSLMEGGIAALQNTGLPTRLVEFGLGVGGAPRDLGSLWRWGALLLLAALAAYGSLLARTRLLLRRLGRRLRKQSVPQLQQQQFFFSDDDDDTCSSCSSDDGSEEDDDDQLSSADEAEEEEEKEGKVVMREGYFGDFGEDEGRNGCFDLRGGREVVKAWGRGDLRFDASALGCILSLCDLDRGDVVRSFLTAGSSHATAAACVASAQPAVVLSAGDAAAGRQVELRLWDARVGGRTPAASTLLSPRLRRRVQRLGGAGKVVYVGDGAGSAAAVDLRRVRSPVGKVADEEATWWDADAVVVGGGDMAGFQEDAPWPAATYRLRPRQK